MDYFARIFERADIQKIREFLINGVEGAGIDPRGYNERLDEALTPVRVIIEQKYPDLEDNDKIMGMVFEYSGVNRDVYMEIGLQCGFILAMQIMSNTKAQPDNERR